MTFTRGSLHPNEAATALKPLDVDAILEAARRTGKVLIVHAANHLASLGAEEAFEWLDAR